MTQDEPVEAEGGTVDEAVENALAILGASHAEVEVEVLAEPSRGLLGIGARAARVRVARRDRREAPDRAVAGGARGAQLPDGLVEHARSLLEDLLRRMGFESNVLVAKGEDGPVLEVASDNSNVVIGKHGQTLDALEYIINRIASREEEAAVRIQVDCEQYRAKRRRSLEDLAHRMAEQARRRRRSVTLEPARSPYRSPGAAGCSRPHHPQYG
jgi:spoIIIJ-associated protein